MSIAGCLLPYSLVVAVVGPSLLTRWHACVLLTATLMLLATGPLLAELLAAAGLSFCDPLTVAQQV